MDPRHLLQLANILESGSISKASKVLHLTQPTLTHNMQALEVMAGGKLFERSRFGVRSTALGEVLAREGRAIERRIRDANEACVRHQGGFRLSIRLGTGPLVGAALVPDLLKELSRAGRQYSLSVQSDRPHLLLDQLVDGRHDFVIAPTWLDKPPPGIERFLMVHDHIGIFCSRTHVYARTGKLQGKTEWLSMGTTSPFDRSVRDMLQEVGLQQAKSSVTVMGDTQMLMRILAQGNHLAVLPKFPMQTLGSHYELVELQVPSRPTPRDIYLWCRSELLEDTALVALKKSIISFAQLQASQFGKKSTTLSSNNSGKGKSRTTISALR